MRLQVIVLGLAGATTALWLPNNDLERGALVKRGECDDAYNNEDLYNCPRPNGHELNADGSCGKLADIQPDDTECNVYCEVRRRNFLGKKQTPNGPFGEQQAPGYALVLQEGLEVSVTEGISFGLDAALNKAFALGASLEFSVTKTTSKSIQREGEASDDYWNKWVYWPVLTTTCGSVTSATWYEPGFEGDGGVGGKLPWCYMSEIKTSGNICSTVPLLNDEGNPKTVWSLEYLKDGRPVSFEEQPVGYQAAVVSVGAGFEDPELFVLPPTGHGPVVNSNPLDWDDLRLLE